MSLVRPAAVAVLTSIALACTPEAAHAPRPRPAVEPEPTHVAEPAVQAPAATDALGIRTWLVRDALDCEHVGASAHEDRRLGCAALEGLAAGPAPDAPPGVEEHWIGIDREADAVRDADHVVVVRLAVRRSDDGGTRVALAYAAVPAALRDRIAAAAAGDPDARAALDADVRFGDTDWLALDPAQPGAVVVALLGTAVVRRVGEHLVVVRGDPNADGHDPHASIAELVRVSPPG